MRFQGLALHCRRQLSWESGFAPGCAELRGFTAEISQTVEKTVNAKTVVAHARCAFKTETPQARVLRLAFRVEITLWILETVNAKY